MTHAESWPTGAGFVARIFRRNGRFPGYWSMPVPEKRRQSESCGLVFVEKARNSSRNRIGGSRVRWKARNGSLRRSARGIEGDLRVGMLLCRPAQALGGSVACSNLVHVDRREVFQTLPGQDLTWWRPPVRPGR